MANPHKGEVTIEIEGHAYTLVFSSNAICEIEEHLDRGWFDIAYELSTWGPAVDVKGKPKPETEDEVRRRLARIRMSLLRVLFWGMLRQHHPGVTLADAGRLMGLVDGEGGVLALVSQVFERSMPGNNAGGSENPRVPGAARNANGTGKTSAISGVRSA